MVPKSITNFSTYVRNTHQPIAKGYVVYIPAEKYNEVPSGGTDVEVEIYTIADTFITRFVAKIYEIKKNYQGKEFRQKKIYIPKSVAKLLVPNTIYKFRITEYGGPIPNVTK